MILAHYEVEITFFVCYSRNQIIDLILNNKIMNFSEREHEIIKYWENQKIFEKSLCKESPKGQFVFYDGPPFATGLPHYGHIVANVMKDVVPRYFTMRGFHVDRVW